MSSDLLAINCCENCGSEAFHVEHISEVFDVDGRFCLVEGIPAMVCDRCGEELFSSETVETIRVALNKEDKAIRETA